MLIAVSLLAMASAAPPPADAEPAIPATGVILADVANGICREPGLVSTTIQQPRVEYRPVYLPRFNFLFAVPGMNPRLRAQYGVVGNDGGVGLALIPKRGIGIFDAAIEAQIAAALTDRQKCADRLIGILLDGYMARAQRLPRVYP